MAVTTAVLIGGEAQSGREELGLHEGLDVEEVQVALWAPESPGGRIIRVCG
jgi:hypothetical protein